MRDRIQCIFEEAVEARKELLDNTIEDIEKAAGIIISSLESGGKLLIFGNGGSASDAQHMASELVNKFGAWRKALPAVSLSTDPSVVTSISNDAGYRQVFARQLEALGGDRDIALGISTSGESDNIITGMNKARELAMGTIALTGKPGNSLEKLVDVSISGGDFPTPRIQENHILVIHILCDLIDGAFS